MIEIFCLVIISNKIKAKSIIWIYIYYITFKSSLKCRLNHLHRIIIMSFICLVAYCYCIFNFTFLSLVLILGLWSSSLHCLILEHRGEKWNAETSCSFFLLNLLFICVLTRTVLPLVWRLYKKRERIFDQEIKWKSWWLIEINRKKLLAKTYHL